MSVQNYKIKITEDKFLRLYVYYLKLTNIDSLS